MSRPFSLQGRLGLGLALGVAVIWLLATGLAGYVIRHEFDEAFDSALQETAQRLLPLAVLDVLGRETPPSSPRVTPLGGHEEFLSYVVRGPAGEVLLQSHDADLSVFPERPVRGFHDTPTHRIFGESAVSGTISIEVAEPLEHRDEATSEAVLALVLPLAILVPLSLAGVWLLVRRSMRPLRRFRAEIEARDGGDLSPIAAGALPAEIAPIAEDVNRLMERLRRVLEAERHFSANSAHELRTPIAATLAQAQRLIAEAPEGPLRHRATQIEVSLHQLARISEKLMQLARAEGGGLLCETPQDLAPVLAHLAAEFRDGAEASPRLRLSLPDGGATPSHMDPDAFAVLVRNLIENALKHGPKGGPVDVTMSGSTVRVVNGGPALPKETLATLKGRFARGATAAKGAGLGLAIADAIAAGAGAGLDLMSPAEGRSDGFEAVLRLPA